jgi:hypothetical protein
MILESLSVLQWNLFNWRLGCGDCPLNHSFQKYGAGVTHCWFRSFWRDFFGLKINIDYPVIQLPRQRDHLLADLFFASGWDIDDYKS